MEPCGFERGPALHVLHRTFILLSTCCHIRKVDLLEAAQCGEIHQHEINSSNLGERWNQPFFSCKLLFLKLMHL